MRLTLSPTEQSLLERCFIEAQQARAQAQQIVAGAELALSMVALSIAYLQEVEGPEKYKVVAGANGPEILSDSGQKSVHIDALGATEERIVDCVRVHGPVQIETISGVTGIDLDITVATCFWLIQEGWLRVRRNPGKPDVIVGLGNKLHDRSNQ